MSSSVNTGRVDNAFSISAWSIAPTLLRRTVEGERTGEGGGFVGCPCVGLELKAEEEGDGICLEDDVAVPKYEAVVRGVTAWCNCCKYTCKEESAQTTGPQQVAHTLIKIRKSWRYFASVFNSSMRAWYLLKSSYFSNFFAFAAASRFCCCPDASSSPSDPIVNDIRADLVRGLGNFGTTGIREETAGKSTAWFAVSPGDEGVLTTRVPPETTRSLRGPEEGGEPETVGAVAGLTRFCALKRSSREGIYSRLRVDLDRLCLTPLPEFWDEVEGRAPGFTFALEVEGVAVVVVGVKTGEARIGVNGVNMN